MDEEFRVDYEIIHKLRKHIFRLFYPSPSYPKSAYVIYEWYLSCRIIKWRWGAGTSRGDRSPTLLARTTKNGLLWSESWKNTEKGQLLSSSNQEVLQNNQIQWQKLWSFKNSSATRNHVILTKKKNSLWLVKNGNNA